MNLKPLNVRHDAFGFLTGGQLAGIMTMVLCGTPALAQIQSLGITTQGNTGGLVIPSADVLPLGSLALTAGNYREPQLGAPRSTEQNMSFGVGMLPHVEFFGRFANYTNPVPNTIFFTGVRDISANLKVQLPDRKSVV